MLLDGSQKGHGRLSGNLLFHIYRSWFTMDSLVYTASIAVDVAFRVPTPENAFSGGTVVAALLFLVVLTLMDSLL
jgi:hypothetical protein